MGLAVGGKILEDKEFVVAVQQRFVQHAEMFAVDGAVYERVHELADTRVRAVHVPRRIAAVHVVIHDFFRPQAEDDAVFHADFAADFYVGPVHRTQRNGPVHHEFHIARAGRFLAGRGDLLAHVGRREQELSQGYVVVLQEQYLQLLVHLLVAVYHVGHDVDKLDRLLGFTVARRSLAAEQERVRADAQIRICFQRIVQVKDAEDIQQLPFV